MYDRGLKAYYKIIMKTKLLSLQYKLPTLTIIIWWSLLTGGQVQSIVYCRFLLSLQLNCIEIADLVSKSSGRTFFMRVKYLPNMNKFCDWLFESVFLSRSFER